MISTLYENVRQYDVSAYYFVVSPGSSLQRFVHWETPGVREKEKLLCDVRAYYFSFATSLIIVSNDFAPGASPDNCQIIIPEASFFAKTVFLLMAGMPL